MVVELVCFLIFTVLCFGLEVAEALGLRLGLSVAADPRLQ